MWDRRLVHIDRQLHSAWRALGIEPTTDAATVRRPYAAALKTIDVETEPQRFIALRQAFDSVRAGAPTSSDPTADASDAAGSSELRPEGANLGVIQDISTRIVDLLRGPAPVAAIEEELSDLTLRLLMEVELADVDCQVESEEWVANTVAAHFPRSDAMVRPAALSFRWNERRHGRYRPNKAGIVLERPRELNFADNVIKRETGRHHLAWRTLQHAPPRGLFRKPDLAALAAVEAFFQEIGDDSSKIPGVPFDLMIVVQWRDAVRRHGLALDRWRTRRRSAHARSMILATKLLFAGVFGACALMFLFL